jgi:hypothetical protein
MAEVIKKLDRLQKHPVTPQPGDSYRGVCNMFSLRVQRPLCRNANDITALYVRQPQAAPLDAFVLVQIQPQEHGHGFQRRHSVWTTTAALL